MVKINLSSPRLLAAIGVIAVVLGLGIGRTRVEITRVFGSPGDQRGEDFLALNTTWWLVCLGGALIGLAFARHRVRLPSSRDRTYWWYVPLALIGVASSAWLIRAVTAVNSGTGWVDGRPVRRADGTAVLPTVRVEQAPLRAQCWIESARHEFSSIASFLDTADALGHLGAPKHLIERCRHAAHDERKHTDVCLGIAEQLGATGIEICDSVDDLRAPGRSEASIADTAYEALMDGVIGEGFAAARLRRSAQRGDTFSAALSRLALDEQRHADLGADIVEWCLTVDPSLRSVLLDDLGRLVEAPPVGGLITGLSQPQREAAGLCTETDTTAAWHDALTAAKAALGLSRAA